MKDSIICGALSVIIGYLIGNMNTAYLLGRRSGIDVRRSGSGNAGASNAFILMGKAAFAVTALADIAKAWLSWKLARLLFPALTLSGELASSACVLGHMFPVFLHFRGGKGLACLGGLILAFSPKVFCIMLTVFLIAAAVSGYIAVSTVAVAVCWPGAYMLFGGYPAGTLMFCALAVPVVFRHRENFSRIRAGRELRLNFIFRRSEELERIGYGRAAEKNEE